MSIKAEQKGDGLEINILTIYCTAPTKGVTAEAFRKTILALTDGMREEDKQRINLHYSDEQMEDNKVRKVPYVLYGKPHKNSFKLFSYGDEDYRLLERIRGQLKFQFKVGGKAFQIKDVSLRKQDTMPRSAISQVDYATTTPILMFTGKARKWLDWTLNNVKDNTERDKVIQEKLQRMLIENIRYQMQQVFKHKEYANFDAIRIEWKTFKLIRIKSRDKREYAIVGEFKSNYHLPRFVGRRIGIGFGELSEKGVA